MVALDACKKMVWGSVEAVAGACVGGCGLAGGASFINLTRTKWFVLSLGWCRLLGYVSEIRPGLRPWLPPVLLLARLILRCRTSLDMDDLQYATKVGRFKPVEILARGAARN